MENKLTVELLKDVMKSMDRVTEAHKNRKPIKYYASKEFLAALENDMPAVVKQMHNIPPIRLDVATFAGVPMRHFPALDGSGTCSLEFGDGSWVTYVLPGYFGPRITKLTHSIVWLQSGDGTW